MADQFTDEWLADIERLLAIGIAISEGHTFADLRSPMKPGPNTMHSAREVLRRYVEADRG